MAKKDKYYTVTMYRWGNREGHSYFLGLYDKKHKAKEAGRKHKEWRGGKYDPEVLEVDLNTTYMEKGEGPKYIEDVTQG